MSALNFGAQLCLGCATTFPYVRAALTSRLSIRAENRGKREILHAIAL